MLSMWIVTKLGVSCCSNSKGESCLSQVNQYNITLLEQDRFSKFKSTFSQNTIPDKEFVFLKLNLSSKICDQTVNGAVITQRKYENRSVWYFMVPITPSDVIIMDQCKEATTDKNASEVLNILPPIKVKSIPL